MPAPLFAGIDEAVRRRERPDVFGWIRDQTDAHRRQHHCSAYPYQDGTVLGAIVGALRPSRVLELGAALGYTACWWAYRGADVDTIESDPIHVGLARTHMVRAQPGGTVNVHQGDFDTVLPTLETIYDVAFFDGYEPPAGLLTTAGARLRPGGLLVTTNLGLGGGRFRTVLSASAAWTTHFVHDLALSVREDHQAQ